MVQINNSPINLRVKFQKIGNLQYVSHLDLVRTMNKIIVRAELPLWYTEGFNPKPKIVFAAPLSIGTESVTEFVDIRLFEKISPEEALERINRNTTEELKALSAYYPDSKMTELKWFSYTVKIKTDSANEALAELCQKALLADKLEVEKKTKSKELVLTDIRPLIKSASAEFCNGEILIYCTLSADQSCFLNPEYVVKALKRNVGILSSGNLVNEYYSIMRNSAYFSDMREFL
jgi:radical SAM-linked protein